MRDWDEAQLQVGEVEEEDIEVPLEPGKGRLGYDDDGKPIAINGALHPEALSRAKSDFKRGILERIRKFEIQTGGIALLQIVNAPTPKTNVINSYVYATGEAGFADTLLMVSELMDKAKANDSAEAILSLDEIHAAHTGALQSDIANRMLAFLDLFADPDAPEDQASLLQNRINSLALSPLSKEAKQEVRAVAEKSVMVACEAVVLAWEARAPELWQDDDEVVDLVTKIPVAAEGVRIWPSLSMCPQPREQTQMNIPIDHINKKVWVPFHHCQQVVDPAKHLYLQDIETSDLARVEMEVKVLGRTTGTSTTWNTKTIFSGEMISLETAVLDSYADDDDSDDEVKAGTAPTNEETETGGQSSVTSPPNDMADDEEADAPGVPAATEDMNREQTASVSGHVAVAADSSGPISGPMGSYTCATDLDLDLD